nr:hypothetical protein CFP56_01291 [Quercus suber]
MRRSAKLDQKVSSDGAWPCSNFKLIHSKNRLPEIGLAEPWITSTKAKTRQHQAALLTPPSPPTGPTSGALPPPLETDLYPAGSHFRSRC